jgi:hypothetical protein
MEKAKISHINSMMNSETVATTGYDNLIANKTIVIPGLRN